MFDIFKVTERGERVWIDAEPSLDAAMTHASTLQEHFPGEYILHSQSTGKDIQLKANGGYRRP